MKKLVFIWMLLFCLFLGMIPVYAQSYTVTVPVSYTCTKSTSTTINFKNDETGNNSEYTLSNNTKKNIEFHYSSLGTYHYTVTREAGNDKSMTYDQKTYKVIIFLERTDDDQIRPNVVIYLADTKEKLSEVSYVDKVNAASDADHQTVDEDTIHKDGTDNPAHVDNQTTDPSKDTKDNSGDKSKSKDQDKSDHQSSKSSKTSKSSKSSKNSSSNGGAGTRTSKNGKNGGSSTTGGSANDSSSANGKNGTMNNGQNGATDATNGSLENGTNGSSKNGTNGIIGTINTGDATSFVKWIILMIMSLVGMVMIMKRKE